MLAGLVAERLSLLASFGIVLLLLLLSFLLSLLLLLALLLLLSFFAVVVPAAVVAKRNSHEIGHHEPMLQSLIGLAVHDAFHLCTSFIFHC